MLARPLGATPSLDALLRALPPRGRFCLDGEPSHPEGGWSFLGAEPAERVAVTPGPSPLAAFDRPALRSAPGDGAGPLAAHEIPWWIVALAYDAAWGDPSGFGLREGPRLARDGAPVVWAARYRALVARHEVSGDAWILAEDEAAADRVARALEGAEAPEARVGPLTVEDPALHRARVLAALEAIAAGEIYQVNLARPWTAAYEGSPLPLWAAMRAASEVPLGFFAQMGARAVIARTMERFLRWDRAAGSLWTAPIKGTRARLGDDRAEASALLEDDKERAEHAMIVDLMRNDLSRVARVGTVRVQDALRVEPFRGLHHLVSTVRCAPREGVTARQILEATFPPGSVTGTPKLRAMELIEALEATPRGLYTGALGYLDRAGGLSLAVAIRTAVIERGQARYFAGGGLVSASDVEREIAETDLKARVFVEAIESTRSKLFV